MPQSQYQMAMPGVTNFGQAINQMAVGLARQKYLMEQQRQEIEMKQAELASRMMHQRAQEALFGAQRKESEAQAGYHTARTGAISSEQAAADMMGQALRGYQQYNTVPIGREEGPFEQTARRANQQQQFLNVVQQAGALAGRGNQYAVPGAAQGMRLDSQKFQELLGLGQKPVVNVGPEATAFNLMSGLPEYQSPRELGRGVNLVDPHPPYNLLAQGQPPVAANELNLSRLLASNQALLNTLMPLGVPPGPENPKFPTYSTTTNQIAQLQALIGAGLQARQGTNASVQTDTEDVFQTLDEAYEAGKKSGDVILLWNEQNKKYQRARIN